MNVDWETIFEEYGPKERPSKFSRLPKCLPWGSDVNDNVALTLEWMLRDGRADDIRFSETPHLNHSVGGWYMVEFEDGRLIHACYPADILKFRGQYESLFTQLHSLDPSEIMMLHSVSDKARTMLWSAWRCFGGDGVRVEPKPPKMEDCDLLWSPPPYPEWPRVWNKQCSRCCAELPKSLQMWVVLQHSILKEAMV